MFLPVFHIRTRLLRLVNPMTYFDSLFDTNSIGCSLILSVMNMRNLSFLIMIVTIVPLLFSVGFPVVVVEYHGHFDIVLHGFLLPVPGYDARFLSCHLHAPVGYHVYDGIGKGV
jgi:hypothetical protein